MSTILLADDDELLRTAASVNLQRHGFRVVEACDGADAIAKAADITPDIVLLDLVMPNSDGFETLRALRGLLPRAKFIMMSGGTSNMAPALYLRMSLELGAHATVRKPFTNEQLLAAIAAVQQPAKAAG
jgi:DNA-binding response OmpR family regulator